MIITDIMNVFIGLALTYATMSLVVSAVTEAISRVMHLRSATLLQGLKDLLNDQDLSGLAGAIINHAAVNPRAPGTDLASSKKFMPSYIPSLHFAAALIDAIQAPPAAAPAVAQVPGQLPALGQAAAGGPAAAAGPLDLAAAIAAIDDDQIRGLLQGIYTRVGGDAAKFHAEVANWFDASMDRVAGVYKRWTQCVSLLIAALVAVGLNVDSFHIAAAVWSHPSLVQNAGDIVAAQGKAADALEAYAKADFPFGWHYDWASFKAQLCTHPMPTIAAVSAIILGWCTTAIATLFGAPFWFDTLQRFVQLGGTGPKPDAAATQLKPSNQSQGAE